MKLSDLTCEEKRERHKQQQKAWRDNNKDRMLFLVKRWWDNNKEKRQTYAAKHNEKLQEYKHKASRYDTCILDSALEHPVCL